ncbi:MAG: hypothetical protein KDA92_06880 [Planctomycetales bacterium]|nr:hypothetical protein [Planctomycetales bacterium]
MNATDLDASLTTLMNSHRILVLGPSGSGKTTLARQLGQLLNLETIHLDALFWKVGWISTPQEEWRSVVSNAVAKPAWVMDGTYESTLHLRIPAAETLVMLERSRLACLWRVCKRKLTIDDDNRPDAPPGQPVDWAFVRYIWRYDQVSQPQVDEAVRQYAADKPIITLKSQRDVHALVRRLETAVAAGGKPARKGQ